MTAGRGIIHNEQPPDGVEVHSLQLWVNLPAADKMVEPRTQNLVAADCRCGASKAPKFAFSPENQKPRSRRPGTIRRS